MPDTVEHRVEMYRLARQRREAGLPVWDRKISFAGVFHNDSMTFTQRRDAIVALLRSSSWLKGRDEFDNLVEVVDNLATAENIQEFDGWWDDLYDIADEERVWIATH